MNELKQPLEARTLKRPLVWAHLCVPKTNFPRALKWPALPDSYPACQRCICCDHCSSVRKNSQWNSSEKKVSVPPGEQSLHAELCHKQIYSFIFIRRRWKEWNQHCMPFAFNRPRRITTDAAAISQNNFWKLCAFTSFPDWKCLKWFPRLLAP